MKSKPPLLSNLPAIILERRDGKLETIFNEIIRLEEPVSLRNYLLGIYRKLRDDLKNNLMQKFCRKRVEDTAARTGKSEDSNRLELDPKLKQDLAMRKLIRSGYWRKRHQSLTYEKMNIEAGFLVNPITPCGRTYYVCLLLLLFFQSPRPWNLH